ncbi:hypothetical protein ANCCAN_13330 [Ancylostoma caninum]|uniref:SXP/RAL-2 family protein Ani s 5-like cation-binding domain-containing protein n=1 Tax=Ancylostoma caninum TaxID=29170 RepID=A0A368G8I1_ANCCA|nr:hypothetical protein ANCCAN_13330 [Ancylostoma caninum]
MDKHTAPAALRGFGVIQPTAADPACSLRAQHAGEVVSQGEKTLWLLSINHLIFLIQPLLVLLAALRTHCALNSFYVGGRARAPSSFWSAGTRQEDSSSHDSLPTVGNERIESRQASVPSEVPPANGFWPDPQAVLEFRRRLKEPKPVDPSSFNNITQKPESLPTVFIHHADRDEALTTPPTLTCAPQDPQASWNIIPNPPGVPDNNVVVPVPTVAAPPPVPLEVLVHWIYDVENKEDGGVPNDGGASKIAPALHSFHPPAPAPPPAPLPLDRPPFLLEASDDIVAEYFKITMDEKLTKRELKCALELWKASLPPYLLTKYEESEAERQRMFAVERDLRAQRVTRLSPLARQVADRIEAVRSNDDFTVLEEEHMIREIMQSVPDEIRDELTAQ